MFVHRWPSVYSLKRLTAKAVCNALFEQFVNVGAPAIITSDQCTNFTTRLTQEFLKVMGCSPRFNTTEHPEAPGLVERSFKKMIHHVIGPYKRDEAVA